MLSIWLKVIRTLFSFSTTSLSPNQILLNAFIVNFITFHLSTYQTCNIKHLTTALGKKGVSLLCTLQENVNMWWSLQLAPCCGALCSQCCWSVQQCDPCGGLNHDGDGSQLGGVSGGSEGSAAVCRENLASSGSWRSYCMTLRSESGVVLIGISRIFHFVWVIGMPYHSQEMINSK